MSRKQAIKQSIINRSIKQLGIKPPAPLPKITKKLKREYMRFMLGKNEAWAHKALIAIFRSQTPQEQSTGETVEENGIGFTGPDSIILTSFAKRIEKGLTLSIKQKQLLCKKMPKYWRQILEITDHGKLEKLIRKS